MSHVRPGLALLLALLGWLSWHGPAAAIPSVSVAPGSIAPGGRASLSVAVSDADPFEALTLAITFDPSVLVYVQDSFAAGSLTADFFFAVNADGGTVFVSGFGIDGAVGGTGGLFTLDLSSLSTAPPGSTAIGVNTIDEARGVPGELQFFGGTTVTIATATAVPEPASLVLLAAGLLPVLASRRR